MANDMTVQNSLAGESFRIALLYMFLVIVFFASVSFFAQADIGDDPVNGFVGQSVAKDAISGFLSFLVMSLVVWKFRRMNMVRNVILCFSVSSAVAVLDFGLTREFYRATLDDPTVNYDIAANIKTLFMCWAMFFGWSCLYLTILYSFDVRDRERRLAASREEALSAQMRALRYQINPHFLFNTLNSIGGLIEEGAATRAERMVLSLSTFLRATLALDPFHDVSLAEELALQEDYLAIEKERFSDRMRVSIDAPPELRRALVPSLILQPLVENAIKHGVGAMTGTVVLSLSASRAGDRLLFSVENDMPVGSAGRKPAGAGVGLRNVEERLYARFQENARFSAGPTAAGTFRATLDMPYSAASPFTSRETGSSATASS